MHRFNTSTSGTSASGLPTSLQSLSAYYQLALFHNKEINCKNDVHISKQSQYVATGTI
jgi:hypothetical protein